MANAIRDPAQLLGMLQLSDELLPAAREAAAQFPLRVPHSFIARMEPGNPSDPLLLQVLPLHQETMPVEGYTHDPVADLSASPLPGLIQKYSGRVLLISTGACAIHCRYCFRRHFPYPQQQVNERQWAAVMDYLRNQTTISEVIFSGGDPFSLTDERISAMVEDLSALNHIKRLRWHTRLPVVIPNRITESLIRALSASGIATIVVLHINHANEIDQHLRTQLLRLKQAGFTLLNQSVLLRGVNDDSQCLIDLSEALFTAGVLPYYLHLLDKVQGAAHFDVNEKDAIQLMTRVRGVLPGYLLPQLVREIPGETSKIPLLFR